MPDTIFSKIIAGEIPCHRVYEDEFVLAFLDINPLAAGHTLVIPKESVATVGELSDESAAAVGRVLPRICRAVMKATRTNAYNILQNNGADAHQEVMHVHFHIIPKYADRPSGQDGLGIGWRPGKLDSDVGVEMAKRIAAEIG